MENDPYLNTDNCVERLYKEYTKHRRLVLAVDFDDTLYPFHGTNYNCNKVIEIVKEAQAMGFYITIFTASRAERHPFIIEHTKSIGIVPDSINKNPIELPFGNEGKIYYNLFLCDRAGLAESFRILRKLLDRIGKVNDTQNSLK
jgi:hypothetical protein